MLNTPNKLTILRIVLVPIYIFFYLKENFWIAIAIFILSAITDKIDGYLARKLKQETNFGKIIDPLADKILCYSAFILFLPNIIPWWAMIIILVREFFISGIRCVAAAKGNVISAKVSGKLKTIFQMISVPALTLTQVFINVNWIEIVAYILFYISLALTIYSGIEYSIKNKEVFK